MKIYTLNNRFFKLDGKLMTVPPPSDEVTIGTQTWKRTNLAIDDGQGGIGTAQVSYDGGATYVTEYYYTWDAAVRVGSSVPGWHLPSRDEWNVLISEIGGKSTAGTKLKSKYGWSYNGKAGNGTDEFNFTVFPSGLYQEGHVVDNEISANYWQNTQYNSLKSSIIYFHSAFKYSSNTVAYKTNYYSVRLVKD